MVLTDFGQTDFGQCFRVLTDFGQTDFGQFQCFNVLANFCCCCCVVLLWPTPKTQTLNLAWERGPWTLSPLVSLGLSCETPAAPPDRACCWWCLLLVVPGAAGARTRQPENSQRAHFRAPALQNTTKIPREDPQRDTERAKRWRERDEKARNFGPPTLPGPHPSGPHPSGAPPFWEPHPSGPHFILGSGPPTLRGPTLRGPHRSGPHFF